MEPYWKVLNKSPFIKMIACASVFSLLTTFSLKDQQVIAATNNKNAAPKNDTNHISTAAAEKPNIVYIVLDDSGFSDLGSYGSEIQTPNLDKLAENGLRYSNSHVAPVCSPTRASLLTGRYSHSFGMASVANFDMGPNVPNKRGRIDPSAGTIAEVLKENDYNTYGAGKWHLAPSHEATAAGPYTNWPLQKGFDRYYGFLEDSTDQYRPELVQDNSFIETPQRENYHFSEDIVDKANEYILNQASFNQDTPFFLYLAFGSQHQPVQVPQKYIDQYDGVYDAGWDEIRKGRFEKQKELGIIDENAKLAPLNPGIKPWNELTPKEQEVYATFQEAYAGMLTHTDEQVGKVIDTLKKVGELDNTIIVFLSDNGASPLGGQNGSINHTLTYNMVNQTFETISQNKDKIGSDATKAEFPAGWAQVSNTPFRFYKSTMYEAGIRTPLIIHYPAVIKDKGEVRNQYVHVADISPTVYELANTQLPKTINGTQQMALHGESFASSLTNDMATGKKVQYYENNGARAIYADGWKAISQHQKGQPYESDTWQLFHVKEDPTELVDLAKENTKKLNELIKLFDQEAKKYHVYPMTDVAADGFLYVPEDSLRAKSVFTYYDGASRIPEGAAPFILNKSYTVTVPIDRSKKDDEGVLVALGSSESGYTLYVKDNKAVYEYNRGNQIYRIESGELPVGKIEIKYEFTTNGNFGGEGRLFVNGEELDSVVIPQAHLFKLSFEGLNVGHDSNYPVSKNYADLGAFDFSGEIEKVVYEIQ